MINADAPKNNIPSTIAEITRTSKGFLAWIAGLCALWVLTSVAIHFNIF